MSDTPGCDFERYIGRRKVDDRDFCPHKGYRAVYNQSGEVAWACKMHFRVIMLRRAKKKRRGR